MNSTTYAFNINHPIFLTFPNRVVSGYPTTRSRWRNAVSRSKWRRPWPWLKVTWTTDWPFQGHRKRKINRRGSSENVLRSYKNSSSKWVIQLGERCNILNLNLVNHMIWMYIQSVEVIRIVFLHKECFEIGIFCQRYQT